MKNSNLSEALGRVFTLENLIKFLILLSVLGLWVMMITGCTDAATTMLATVGVVTTTGGTHITGAPLTAKLTEEHAPSLLRSDIDNRLVKIRPSATPLDQISRMVGARMAKSMKVDYYSVDTKPGKSIVTSQKGGEMLMPWSLLSNTVPSMSLPVYLMTALPSLPTGSPVPSVTTL